MSSEQRAIIFFSMLETSNYEICLLTFFLNISGLQGHIPVSSKADIINSNVIYSFAAILAFRDIGATVFLTYQDIVNLLFLKKLVQFSVGRNQNDSCQEVGI